MLCEICKSNEATGFIEETKNNTRRRIHLCHKCLAEKQKAIFGGVNMFPGFVEAGQINKGKRVRCSTCGTELKTVLSSLFVGCSDCYSQLNEYLAPIIKNVQGAAAHIGVTSKNEQGNQLMVLNQQLKQALNEERYEDAAAINRKIKSLQGN